MTRSLIVKLWIFSQSDCFIKDYPKCNVEVAEKIGNGICNGGKYNVELCGWDGGDCEG